MDGLGWSGYNCYADYSKTKDLLFFTQNLSRSTLIKSYAYIKKHTGNALKILLWSTKEN